MTLRSIACVGLLVVLISQLTACDSGLSRPTPTSQPSSSLPTPPPRGSRIVVGYKSDQPGLNYFDQGTAKPTGFEQALTTDLLQNDLGYNVTRTAITSGDWEDALSSGNADLVLSSISFDPARLKNYIFAGPYLQTSLGALATNPNLSQDQITDLHGMRVCYINNTTASSIVQFKQSTDHSIQTVQADQDKQCLDDLKNNIVDLFFSDSAILLGWIHSDQAVQEQYNNFSYYNEANIPGPPSESPTSESQKYVIALRPNEQSLCQQLDDALSKRLTGSASDQWYNEFQRFVENGRPPVLNEPPIQQFIPSAVQREWCTPTSSQG